MKSVGIILTDHESINEDIILKSKTNLINSKLKHIYFIGDFNKFKNIYKYFYNYKKFKFYNISINKNNYYQYIKKITLKSINLYKEKKINYIINMPIDKAKFFKSNFKGYTEFFSNCYDKKKNENMLLYNENFSVCPVTTHVEINKVEKNITKLKICNTIHNITNFYNKILRKKIKIILLGLNPHASKDLNKNSIDIKLLTPLIKRFKKKINIEGPVSADTAFRCTKGKVYIGMYHDQVLIPFKIINNFNGINITIGKKLLRLSPDHGTGKDLLKNKSKINILSFIKCIKFCEKY